MASAKERLSDAPSIAVVAVHGVADQRPGESARAIADLLTRYGPPASRYGQFQETTLRIPTAPVVVSAPQEELGPTQESPHPYSAFDAVFDDRPRHVRELLRKAKAKGEEAVPPPSPDHEFMRELLERYDSERIPNQTLRLEGQRGGDPSAAQVHIYEMYWADLSRLGTGLLKFLGELYQLLFHVASLGRQTLDYAGMEARYRGVWRRLCDTHRWAVRLLTLPLPALAVVMFAVGLTILPMGLDPPLQTLCSGVLLGLLLAGIVGLQAFQNATRPGFTGRSWTVALAFLLPVLLAALLTAEHIPALRLFAGSLAGVGAPVARLIPYLLALEWVLVAGVALHVLSSAYARYRPGAHVVTLAFYWGSVVLLVCLAFFPPFAPAEGMEPAARVVAATLWTVEIIFLVNGAVWVGLVILVVVGWLLGASAVHREAGDRVSRERARRAVRTARLSLTMPALAFLFVTMVLWGTVVDSTRSLLPSFHHTPLLGHIHEGADIHHLLHDLLWRSVPIGVLPAGLLAVSGFLLGFWWLIPLALSEGGQPPGDDGEVAQRHGACVSRGLPLAIRTAGLVTVLLAALYGAYAASVSGDLLAGDRRPITDEAANDHDSIEWVGRLLGGSLLGLLVLQKGNFTRLAAKLRPVLDVGLDVDGYLREHPRDRTPRARIAERFVSLLRYLCAWRDEMGRPYAAIVLIAHSQGTVITADTLRFLTKEPDAGLGALGLAPGSHGEGRIPVYLFTMGCPLRQLYCEFFPHLYRWVDGPGGPPATPVIPASARPDPSELGIERWRNAYRSGDYIGRYLWRQRTSLPLFAGEPAEDETRRRVDVCIGPGAHTHYWDSVQIAMQLDDLIGVAAR